jgi:hypothetical protein
MALMLAVVFTQRVRFSVSASCILKVDILLFKKMQSEFQCVHCLERYNPSFNMKLSARRDFSR